MLLCPSKWPICAVTVVLWLVVILIDCVLCSHLERRVVHQFEAYWCCLRCDVSDLSVNCDLSGHEHAILRRETSLGTVPKYTCQSSHQTSVSADSNL